jgi:hypothetical protein
MRDEDRDKYAVLDRRNAIGGCLVEAPQSKRNGEQEPANENGSGEPDCNSAIVFGPVDFSQRVTQAEQDCGDYGDAANEREDRLVSS